MLTVVWARGRRGCRSNRLGEEVWFAECAGDRCVVFNVLGATTVMVFGGWGGGRRMEEVEPLAEMRRVWLTDRAEVFYNHCSQ